jgi:hypothetical protein
MHYSCRTSNIGTRGSTALANRPARGVSSTRYSIQRRGRFWEVLDASGELVCLTVYKRGAKEVIRRLPG